MQQLAGGSLADEAGNPARVSRLWRVGRRRLNYFAEYFGLIVLALIVMVLVWVTYLNLPSRPVPKAWDDAPQRVWTLIEAAALRQQLVDGSLGVSADLYGPGPVPLDRGGSESPADAQRQRFNQLTELLMRAHQARLNGDRFGEQSLQTLRENFVALRGRANPGQQGAQDIAYQLAVVDFLNGQFGYAREGLAAAGCNRQLPANTAGEDENANARSKEIRCFWLEGRLELAPDQLNPVIRKQGLAKLRTALEQAIAASPADQEVVVGPDLPPGPGGRSRFPQIPSLLSGDYWMFLPEAAGASLWQDYLAALLATKTDFCSGLCSTWDDWPRGAPTAEGLKFADLVRDNNKDIWRDYPELAALARMILITNGMVIPAREIGPEEGRLNLTSAGHSSDGFQLVRSGSRQDTVSLDRDYFEFARLAMIVSQADPGDPAPDKRAISDASRLWLAHNESRRQWLGTGSSDVENPFDEGTPGYKAFTALQEQWSAMRPGNFSWFWLVARLVVTLFPLIVIAFAIRAARALAPSRERHRAELFGSKYFASAQDIVARRGGGANA